MQGQGLKECARAAGESLMMFVSPDGLVQIMRAYLCPLEIRAGS